MRGPAPRLWRRWHTRRRLRGRDRRRLQAAPVL